MTAAFTVNALRHVNAVAGLDFDWRHGWRHAARYVDAERAIVTHVHAVGPQVVLVPGVSGAAALPNGDVVLATRGPLLGDDGAGGGAAVCVGSDLS